MSKKTPEITPPIQIEQWFMDLGLADRLRALLEDPTFKIAAATLKEAAGPSFSTLSPDPESNAMKQAWYAGYRDAFKDLQKLTHPKTGSTNLPTEWAHISLDK